MASSPPNQILVTRAKKRLHTVVPLVRTFLYYFRLSEWKSRIPRGPLQSAHRLRKPIVMYPTRVTASRKGRDSSNGEEGWMRVQAFHMGYDGTVTVATKCRMRGQISLSTPYSCDYHRWFEMEYPFEPLRLYYCIVSPSSLAAEFPVYQKRVFVRVLGVTWLHAWNFGTSFLWDAVYQIIHRDRRSTNFSE